MLANFQKDRGRNMKCIYCKKEYKPKEIVFADEDMIVCKFCDKKH